MKKFFKKIFAIFIPEYFYQVCSEEIEDIFPINTFNSSDAECLKNDFERVIGKF